MNEGMSASPSLANQDPARPGAPAGPSVLRIALLGNPNVGKTTIFNALCGLRHKTGNFPGTTQEARIGRIARDPRAAEAGEPRLEVIDLPGTYSLELEQNEADVCRRVLAGTLAAPGQHAREPDVACVVVDATNLERNLLLVGEVLRRRLPTVVALNMIDLARTRPRVADHAKLEQALGCAVVPCSAREGEGLLDLQKAMLHARLPNRTPAGSQDALESWARQAFEAALPPTDEPGDEHARHYLTKHNRSAALSSATDRLDHVLTHPLMGMAAFLGVMFALFYAIFRVAEIPMGLIEAFFAGNSAWVRPWMPDLLQVAAGEGLTGLVRHILPGGTIQDFLADGVVGGVGATLVFLPQICLLFFLISLLEDTGYLARAAFLVDRFMRPFGLSGQAFIPLLSSHACALPGIMATRAIPDRRERLAAILVAPFMSCSARIPVYVLLTAILFPQRPAMQALAFIGCYALGALAGLSSALLARRTLLKGKTRAMALELPTYKMPSLKTAALTTWDRAVVFLKKAGTTILAISVVLWWLGSYPHVPSTPEAAALRAQAGELAAQRAAQPRNEALTTQATDLLTQADRIDASNAQARSYLGRIGRTAQPIFAPLGYDWQLSVGVISSFAAREVFASTMAVLTTGSDEGEGAIERIASAKRDDGVTNVFTPAVAWSLLVYYVLAMQCLPTLAVTAKEAGGVKWALLQLAWMCALAYIAAMVVFQAMG
jgi:ferrous iron transport protein B